MRNALLAAWEAHLNTGGVPTINIYSGVPPADESTALSGNTVLAGFPSADWAAPASGTVALTGTQQIGLVMMGASIPPGLLWKTMDGTFVEMTQALAASVFAAAAAQDQATFTAAEVAKAAMTASPTAFDLSAVAWPAIFE